MRLGVTLAYAQSRSRREGPTLRPQQISRMRTKVTYKGRNNKQRSGRRKMLHLRMRKVMLRDTDSATLAGTSGQARNRAHGEAPASGTT